MKQATNKMTPFYNFLVSPRCRIPRYICLIVALSFVTSNYAIPYMAHHIFGRIEFTLFLSIILLSYISVACFTIYILIPRYLLRKKHLLFISWLSVTVCTLLVVQYVAEIIFCHILSLPLESMYNWQNKLILIIDVFANFFINLIAFTGGSVTVLLKNWLINDQKAAKLEEEHLSNEVEHLKEQINPGFMFRTLHQAGTLENTDPVQASDILMKLSRLLRYQLYDCNHSMVFMLSEIRYIENYLSLEKTYKPELSFNVTAEGEIYTTLVPPLLFIPFIQQMANQMKALNNSTKLDIAFSCNDETVNLFCKLYPEEEVQHIPAGYIPELDKVIQRLKILFRDNYALHLYPGASGDVREIHLQFNADTL